jgi:hypothetical protein
MSSKRLVIAVLVSICTFIGYARAQKNELAGIVGRTFISDQIIPTSPFADNKLRFGDGLTFEGNISRQVMGGQFLALSVEVPVLWNVDIDVHTHTSPVSPGFSSLFVTYCRFAVGERRWWIRTLQRERGPVHAKGKQHQRCLSDWGRTRRRLVSPFQHPRRAARLLVGHP